MAIQRYDYKPIQPPNEILDNEVGTPDQPRPPAAPSSGNPFGAPPGPIPAGRMYNAGAGTPAAPAPTGLMNTARTASGANIPSAPSYDQEDADVVTQLNRITDRNNPYMMQARAAGLQTANKRGLLSSSMAAGASQAAALERAGPLAQANAQNINARNLERMRGENEAYALGQTLQSEEYRTRLTESGAMERVKLQEASAMERLGRQLTSEEKRAIEENELKRELTTQTEAGALERAKLAESAALERAKLAEAAASERLGRQLTQSEIESIRTSETQKAMQEFEYQERAKLLERELGSRETISAADRAAELERTRLGEAGALERAQLGEMGATERANLQAAAAIRDRELASLSDQQRAALDYYSRANNDFFSAVTQLYNNKDMPAAARDQAIQYLVSVKNAQSDVPAGIYGVKMDWPGAAPAAGTPPAGLIGETPTTPIGETPVTPTPTTPTPTVPQTPAPTMPGLEYGGAGGGGEYPDEAPPTAARIPRPGPTYIWKIDSGNGRGFWYDNDPNARNPFQYFNKS